MSLPVPHITIFAGVMSPEGQREEALPAAPIGSHFARILVVPFYATALGRHDIVRLDSNHRVVRLELKTTYSHVFSFDPTTRQSRAAGRIIRYLARQELSCSFHGNHPGMVTVERPCNKPLEWLWDLVEKCPLRLSPVLPWPGGQWNKGDAPDSASGTSPEDFPDEDIPF